MLNEVLWRCFCWYWGTYEEVKYIFTYEEVGWMFRGGWWDDGEDTWELEELPQELQECASCPKRRRELFGGVLFSLGPSFDRRARHPFSGPRGANSRPRFRQENSAWRRRKCRAEIFPGPFAPLVGLLIFLHGVWVFRTFLFVSLCWSKIAFWFPFGGVK